MMMGIYSEPEKPDDADNPVRHANLPAVRQQGDGMQRVGADAAALERFAQFLAGGRRQDIEDTEIPFHFRAIHFQQARGLGIDSHRQTVRTPDHLRVLRRFKKIVPPLFREMTRCGDAFPWRIQYDRGHTHVQQ